MVRESRATRRLEPATRRVRKLLQDIFAFSGARVMHIGMIRLVACMVIVVGTGIASYQWRRASLAEETSTTAEANDTVKDTPSTDRASDVQDTSQQRSAADTSPGPGVQKSPLGALIELGVDTFHVTGLAGNELLDRLAGLSADEERRMGAAAYQHTISHHQVISSPVLQRRIERLAQPFLDARVRRDIDYTFTIVDDDTINAFAHLGGYVYVNRGLLDVVQDESELGFIMGHEIAHVDRRHCVKNMTAIVRAEQVGGRFGGSLASLVSAAISVGYSEDYELDADRWSYIQMRHAGASHAESLSGIRLLEREFGSDGDHHAHGPLVVEHIRDHFRTHPRISERISQLQRLEHGVPNSLSK